MVFANLLFLYLFLPLNLLFYFLSQKIVYRNLVLVCFSFLFYAWGEPVWFFLLMTSAAFDYMHGRLIERYRGSWVAKAAVVSSLCLNLGLLITFKYSGFLVQNLNAILGTAFPVPAFALPIGISFYTFQTISYVIDVYRGDTKAQQNPVYYLLYLSMYHQLVAGPVVRYADVASEIRHRTVDAASFSEGATRLIYGLCKKVIVANAAGKLVDQYMGAGLSGLSVAGAWFGALMFTLQIYYDFSGYSDMAIGLGRMFGFHYKENFNYPYIAKSATEFWRRWHISLSSFFRDYVYIPLGGNRKHQYLNLLAVWFLTGFWHGASWNFILWGLYFGFFIALEKKFLLGILQRLPAVVQHLYLLLIAVVGWVLFYFTDMKRLGGYLSVMFGLSGNRLWDSQVEITLLNNLFWLILAVVFCLPIVKEIKREVSERMNAGRIQVALCGQAFINLALLLICTAQLVGQSYNPFLYYRF
ncbi:MBOAT family O-acyltransferase [Anaerotruncus rubiinfantis]|uniref:MBOAT family O-acyltransferase n=3 Tax=Anaerotruncus rubiinfantis TaxID=1720200 RepID=UPI00189859C3|nr:MBOAT family protein [Anaerotruncus rubiinfantis]